MLFPTQLTLIALTTHDKDYRSWTSSLCNFLKQNSNVHYFLTVYTIRQLRSYFLSVLKPLSTNWNASFSATKTFTIYSRKYNLVIKVWLVNTLQKFVQNIVWYKYNPPTLLTSFILSNAHLKYQHPCPPHMREHEASGERGGANALRSTLKKNG
jgi:uncharacterized protein YdaL